MDKDNQNEKKGVLWLKLDPISEQNLKQAFPPMYSKHFYHHVTLLFGVIEKDVAPLVGQHHLVHCYAHAFNDKIQAVRMITHGLPDTYGVPHITLSARPGIEPFESVAMLNAEHTEENIEPKLDITGVIEFIPDK